MASALRVDHGSVTWPAILVHGGAGAYARVVDSGVEADGLVAGIEAALAAAVDAGWNALTRDAGPLAAVVTAVTYLEDHGGFNAGRGSVPTTAGSVEMDAAVMDDTGRAGAVACISWHSPIRAAEAVLHHGGPLLIVGPNADVFAGTADVPTLNPAGIGSAQISDPAPLTSRPSDLGTVGAVAVSAEGRFAAGTSTGGRAGQLPGRVGDTPIPGAGLWARPGCGVSATGTGEAFILAGFSRLVAERHAAGENLSEALRLALEAVGGYGGSGGGIALGADRTWAAAFTSRAMARGIRHAEGRRTAVLD
jgi:isoaspartyl peptidase/L-asparaginase-like protein (Ntn-hydrolase superfamily)